MLPGETGITQAQTPRIRITYFLTGAEQPVIRTIVIIDRFHADIIHLITGINRTRNPVTAVDRHSRLAFTPAITGFLSVAVLIVTTGASLCFKLAVRTAAVTARGVPVVTSLTLIHNTVTAGWRRSAGTGVLVADRTVQAGITPGRAVVLGVTEFITIAEEAVIRAVIVIRRVHTSVIGFVTVVICTSNPVTAVDRRTGLAATNQVACFHTVTVLSIVTAAVVRCVFTGVIHLVTGINGTRNPVVTVDRYPRLAVTAAITGFLAVAVLVVPTWASR